MRVNLTKKEIINSVFMQIGFSNSLKVCEKIVHGNLIEKIKDNIIN